ncbi:MAG: class I SAM-dependent methyltransferase [Desulfarculus sp.]|nr:class I SAM-dependent methyltransferase [Desulfarculus sp.]
MNQAQAQQTWQTAREVSPFGADFWEGVWQEAKDASPLKSSQQVHPQRWRDFYDRMGAAWQQGWGEPWVLGRRVTDLLLHEGLLAPGSTVLDLGCGPGTMSIPLAESGARVTALDSAQGMIAALNDEASQRGLEGVEARCQCWRQVLPVPSYDLVLAASFPPALGVEGLQRMESLSRGQCALVLSCGGDPFSFRRELWERVLQEPYPSSGFHQSCALNYLLASGCQPNLRHLSWDQRYSQPLESVVGFYKAYFAIFGVHGPLVEENIRQVLAPWVQDDVVEAQGRVGIAVLWWSKQP